MNEKEEKKQSLVESITKWRKDRYGGQKRWSAVHHTTLFGSIVCSVLAGTLIQLGTEFWATLCTTLAAVLTGIASSGGFERKWKSNRLSRCRADCLLLEIENEKADLDSIRKKYCAAIEKHDLEVVGDKDEETKA